MLTYLFQVTESMILAGIIAGIIFSFMKTFYGTKGRNALFIASSAALIAAIVMSYAKNTTKRFDMTLWNLRTLTII